MKHWLSSYLLIVILLLSHRATFAQTYIPNTAFQPLLVKKYFGGVSSAIVQADQKILIGGHHDYVNNMPAPGIVRLHPDGSVDNTFGAPKEVESVSVMKLRSNGKILAGKLIYGEATGTVLRFFLLGADGSLDSTYTTSIRCDLFYSSAFAVQKDNKFILGANTFGSTGNKGLVYRLLPDGSVDPSFDSGAVPIRFVEALAAQPDGKIIILGEMQHPTLPAGFKTSIVRLNADGSLDTSFKYHTSNHLFAICLQDDGKILLGRNGAHESDRTGLTRLNADGTLDATFKAGNADTTYYDGRSIVLQPDGKIVASIWRSGSTRAGYGRGQVARFYPDGSLDTSFNAGKGAEYTIPLLALQKDSKVLVGGSFTTYNGTRTSLVRLRGDTGGVDPTFFVRTENNGFVQALARQSDGKLLVGGRFETANTEAQSYLTRLQQNGQVDPTFKISTGLDEYTGSTSGVINAIAVQPNDKIWVGGYFTSFNGQKTNSLIRLKADGSTDATFAITSTEHYRVEAILLQADHKILVGGNFPFAKDSSKHLIRFHADGSPDETFNAGPSLPQGVAKILLQPDGKILLCTYVTRNFTSSVRRIVRLTADGTIDATFAPYETQNWINAMALQPDGRLVISGSLSVPGSQTTYKMLRLAANGSIDSSFNFSLGDKDNVTHIVKQADGKLLLTGAFASFNRPILRLKTDGTLDSSLVVNTTGVIKFTGNVLQSADDLFLTHDYSKLIKLSTQAPLRVEALDNRVVKLYPNPAVEKFTIEIPLGWRVEEAALYNALGKPVFVSLTNTSTGYRVHTNNAPAGLYLLHVLTTQGKFTKRVLLK